MMGSVSALVKLMLPDEVPRYCADGEYVRVYYKPSQSCTCTFGNITLILQFPNTILAGAV
jgi:hypothetical protein